MITSATRLLRGRLSRVLVAGLALLLAWLPMATPAAAKTDGQHLPFSGSLQAVESDVFNPVPPVSVSVTAQGSGNATRLGRFSYSYTVVLFLNPDNTGTGTLHYDFVAANGDHLFSVGEGVGGPAQGLAATNHVVEQHTITGGTGRFEGATGRFTVDRLISDLTLITTGTITGYIVLPRQEVHTTASFIIAAGQCPNLPAGVSVTGSGSRVTVTDTTVNADTSSQQIINDVAKGTATGSNGQAYTFYYANTSIWDATVSGPVKVKMYDLFLLQTDAPAASGYALRNGFAWRWSYTPPAGAFDVWPPANFQPSATIGEPLNADASARCDPL
jgi:hypothetical protein